MHHPGRDRQKVRRTDRCGRTIQAVFCMRLVESLDMPEVCRVKSSNVAYVITNETSMLSVSRSCIRAEEI
jgi:hypothetical protein